MGAIVWVTAWQQECCGDLFEVGDEVHWHVLPPDTEWLTGLLGAERAEGVTGMEEHHDQLPRATELTGRVRSIQAVVQELEQRLDGLYPVAGTAVLTEVEAADGWYGSDGDPGRFAGYLVELDR